MALMSDEKFEGWAILELMGHMRVAGYVRDVAMFGGNLARVDIPSEPPVTQFCGAAAIFRMTVTTEAMARAMAKKSAPAPVAAWELPRLPASMTPPEPTSDRDIDPDTEDNAPHSDDFRF